MTTTTSEPAVRGTHSPHERALRNGLGALALVNLVIGVWMVVAPASFVDNVGPFGEPNDHYVRDLATWYLSYAGVLTVAVLVLGRARSPQRWARDYLLSRTIFGCCSAAEH